VSVVLVGSSPIGGPIIGVLAERLGARAALAVGGGVAVVAALLTLKSLKTLRCATARAPA